MIGAGIYYCKSSKIGLQGKSLEFAYVTLVLKLMLGKPRALELLRLEQGIKILKTTPRLHLLTQSHLSSRYVPHRITQNRWPARLLLVLLHLRVLDNCTVTDRPQGCSVSAGYPAIM